MKAKKVMALCTALAMTISMVGCGSAATTTNESAETETTEAAAEETAAEETAAEETAEETTGEVSIDFEDGKFGFVGNDKTANSAADDSQFSVEDYNGSKALKVTPQGKFPYVGIQVDALLGDNVSKLKTVEMTIGTENHAGWSVYLEDDNPKAVSYTVPDGKSFVEGNFIVVSLEVDNGKAKGATQANMYIDNIVFKDADGNVLSADTDAVYVAASTGADRSNLAAVTGAVEFADFACSGDGWAQNGFDMPQEVIDALVPGSVVEITYTSESGDMWIVMPDAAAGWMRVAQGNADGSGSEDAVSDGSKCYVTYEQIAAVCGDDVSTWGARMQCESDSAWEVYGVKVGTAKEFKMVKNLVEFPDFAVSGDGWSQAGATMPQEILDALVPGSVVTISYSSENGDLWIVMNEAAAGWMRVGQGNADGSGSDSAAFNGSTCQVTYEQIAALCGDDVSTWGSTMQCEASGAWEVYSVAVGMGE